MERERCGNLSYWNTLSNLLRMYFLRFAKPNHEAYTDKPVIKLPGVKPVLKGVRVSIKIGYRDKQNLNRVI